MGWEKEVEELRRREAMARRMDGPDKIKRQHDGGKLTVRERIDRLLDTASFHEIGTIAGKAEYDADGTLVDFMASNFVTGRGRIDGRPVVVGVEEIIDPRDTRRLLCEFAHLAAPMRKPGPRSFGFRP